MGREIRRVPPNWEHPKRDQYDPLGRRKDDYQPMHEESVQDAWQDWLAEYQKWLDGGHDEVIAEYGEAEYPKNEPYRSFCHWHGEPPEPRYYCPHRDEGTATWWQVYETVSEGTPVSPPFATQDELIEYLVANGDFWDQKRRKEGSSMSCRPWTRKEAEAFVRGPGWAPSMVMDSKGFRSGVQALADEVP